MSCFQIRLKELRENSNMSQREFAKAFGVSQSAIGNWESGAREPNFDTIQRIAEFFNVSVDYLLVRETNDIYASIGAMPIKKIKLPVLGNVACGEPIYANEELDGYVYINEDIGADFCLHAHGDSMVNARIFDGDTLFVKKQDMVDDGEIAVVLIEDEATVKRVYYDRENNTITLMPENPAYKPMRYNGEELNNIRILGKVIARYSRVK